MLISDIFVIPQSNAAAVRTPFITKEVDMEIVAILALGTMGFVAAFAYLSVRAIEELRNSDAPKSALSRDGAQDRLKAAARLTEAG
jgi:hypothetical protein